MTDLEIDSRPTVEKTLDPNLVRFGRDEIRRMFDGAISRGATFEIDNPRGRVAEVQAIVFARVAFALDDEQAGSDSIARADGVVSSMLAWYSEAAVKGCVFTKLASVRRSVDTPLDERLEEARADAYAASLIALGKRPVLEQLQAQMSADAVAPTP